MRYDPRNAQDYEVVSNPFEEGVTTSLSVTVPTKIAGRQGFYGVRGVYSTSAARAACPAATSTAAGIGYFHYGFRNDLKDGLEELDTGLNDESGIEAFYNLALAPWMRVSADLQWIDPATPDRENAVIGAVRTQIKF
jgi:hypothetical protein